ncbi:MAG TPA: ligase-associated DNA damage response endonuclease PdeM [Cyclobacteriaceae bacterium]|nr:ligase-associated DNA damage response endonuclease PdeM [Cyclobacteriaceae bacterium]
MEIEISGERAKLLWQKAVWLPQHKTLLVADLHIGKINHFRKAGIPVPPKANDRNTETLIDLLNETKADRVIFLGDLFHSYYNEEWAVLGQVLRHFSTCSFELVRGNHDIMSQLQYQRHRIVVHEDRLQLGGLHLTHQPILGQGEESNRETAPGGLTGYNLAGHIHPGIRLTGRGRQSMTLPCFYFGKDAGILPAFGSFTGLAILKPKVEARIFIIADNKVQQIN